MLTVPKFFNACASYTFIGIQLKARSLKMTSHLDHICRGQVVKDPKNEQELLKLAMQIYTDHM